MWRACTSHGKRCLGAHLHRLQVAKLLLRMHAKRAEGHGGVLGARGDEERLEYEAYTPLEQRLMLGGQGLSEGADQPYLCTCMGRVRMGKRRAALGMRHAACMWRMAYGV